MFSEALHHDLVSIIERELVLIYTLAYKCIIDIRDCHDARLDRDLFTLKSFRITRAVPALMMVVRDIYRNLVECFVLSAFEDGINDASAF